MSIDTTKEIFVNKFSSTSNEQNQIDIIPELCWFPIKKCITKNILEL